VFGKILIVILEVRGKVPTPATVLFFDVRGEGI
jgi:hypothetical protein